MLESKTNFMNRKDAGIQLAHLLSEKFTHQNILVLGLSCGGVEVADEVAKKLNAELSFLIAKKVRTCYNKEFTTGAIAEEGQIFFPSSGSIVNEPELQNLVESESCDIQDSVQRFRNGKPLPKMQNRTIILIDDGICSNTTFVTAVNLCRKRKAAKVIVASPVGGYLYVKKIAEIADETIVLQQPDNFYAIGQVYETFTHMNDYEITQLLDNYSNTQKPRSVSQQMVANHTGSFTTTYYR